MKDSFDQLIENVAMRLPDLPEQVPKNLFDILGIRNKETINSRILAYFLDVNESHGLGDLFFQSLKTIVEKKQYCKTEYLENFNGDFKVITEDTTAFAEKETKKRIDLTIIGDDYWGVIIENKLYHNLINPLKAYWQHTQKVCGSKIIGIVLTLHPTRKELIKVKLKEKEITYLNITHKEWIAEVQNQLNIGEIKNLDGILYLKEYIKTIDSHYQTKMSEPEFNKLALSITEQRDKVAEIKNKFNETAKFLDQQIADVFAIYNYEKVGSWYTNKESKYPLYFFISNSTHLLTSNTLSFTFEIRNDLNSAIRKQGKESKINNYFTPLLKNCPFISAGKGSSKAQTHIAICRLENFLNTKTNSNFKKAFKTILENEYMGKGRLIEQTEKFLTENL